MDSRRRMDAGSNKFPRVSSYPDTHLNAGRKMAESEQSTALEFEGCRSETLGCPQRGRTTCCYYYCGAQEYPGERNVVSPGHDQRGKSASIRENACVHKVVNDHRALQTTSPSSPNVSASRASSHSCPLLFVFTTAISP